MESSDLLCLGFGFFFFCLSFSFSSSPFNPAPSHSWNYMPEVQQMEEGASVRNQEGDCAVCWVRLSYAPVSYCLPITGEFLF